MVGVIRRMHALREILSIRYGPGAAILPANVSRIHLEFAKGAGAGHMGPRKFWRDNLPRLKFWNPAVPMIVNRKIDTEGPATLSLYFREGDGPRANADLIQPSSATDGSSTAPTPVEGERVVVIDVKGLHSNDIIETLVRKTAAREVEPSPEDNLEMQEIADLRQRGEVDRKRNLTMLKEQRREKARLAQAMSEAAAIKASAQ